MNVVPATSVSAEHLARWRDQIRERTNAQLREQQSPASVAADRLYRELTDAPQRVRAALRELTREMHDPEFSGHVNHLFEAYETTRQRIAMGICNTTTNVADKNRVVGMRQALTYAVAQSFVKESDLRRKYFGRSLLQVMKQHFEAVRAEVQETQEPRLCLSAAPCKAVEAAFTLSRDILAKPEPSTSELVEVIDRLYAIEELGPEPQLNRIDYEHYKAARLRLFSALSTYGKRIYAELSSRLQETARPDDLPNSAAEGKVVQTRRSTADAVEETVLRRQWKRESSLANWQAYTTKLDDLTARAYMFCNFTAIGRNAFVLDTTTRTFAARMKSIRAHDESRLRDLRRREQLERTLIGDELKREVKASPAAAPAAAIEHAPTGRALAAECDAPERVDVADARSAGARLEAETARRIKSNYSAFASIIGCNVAILNLRRSIVGEIDVHLDIAIVECTLTARGKLAQIRKLRTDLMMNPLLKPVILYAPNYTEAAEEAVQRLAIVVRTPEQLGTALFAIKAASLGWVRPSAA